MMLWLFKFLAKIILWFVGLSLAFVLLFKFVPPPITATMVMNGDGITKDWESLSNIDRNLVTAVIAAEDGKFCSHDGFDVEAIEKAIEQNAKGGRIRGGSTISQQTAKNVFLWQGGGYFRKGLEAWFTFWIENVWGKERIMEVYLNIAGGYRLSDPAADMAVAAALVSALADKPLPDKSVWFGEVSLSGEVRPVAHANLRVKEADKLGFSSAFGPASSKTGSSKIAFNGLGQVANLVDRVMSKS